MKSLNVHLLNDTGPIRF